jgi:hypothetical protein
VDTGAAAPVPRAGQARMGATAARAALSVVAQQATEPPMTALLETAAVEVVALRKPLVGTVEAD